MPITNQTLQDYKFLDEMYKDGYFPDHVVDMGKAILIRLCEKIESEKPSDLEELYKLSHAATDEFNDLQSVFEENESELETAARDCIGGDFEQIAIAYGFTDADVEELIATRDW
jgi:Family of unknown function (DUF5713)